MFSILFFICYNKNVYVYLKILWKYRSGCYFTISFIIFESMNGYLMTSCTKKFNCVKFKRKRNKNNIWSFSFYKFFHHKPVFTWCVNMTTVTCCSLKLLSGNNNNIIRNQPKINDFENEQCYILSWLKILNLKFNWKKLWLFQIRRRGGKWYHMTNAITATRKD